MPSAAENASLEKSASRLNNLIEVLSRSSRALDQICGGNPEARRHLNALSTGLAGACLVISDLLKQVEALSSAPTSADTHASKSSVPPLAPPTAAPLTRPPSPAKSPVPAEPEDTSSLIENPDGSKELVLIIDDEGTIVTYVRETLIRDGYRVIGCTNPFEAIKAYKRFKDSIAFVILDYTLPIMNGQEVFGEIRSHNPRAVVMLSSGFAEQKDVNAMLSRGLRGFLPKPYTGDRLLAQVRSTITAARGGSGASPSTGGDVAQPVPAPTGVPKTV